MAVTRKTLTKHPDLQRILDNHTIASPYMIQYFKSPRHAPCNCYPCRKNLWPMPIVQDSDMYWQMQNTVIPLPIPNAGKPSKYLPLEEAEQLPFTAEHEPLLVAKKATRAAKDSNADGAGRGRGRGRGRGASGRKRKERDEALPPNACYIEYVGGGEQYHGNIARGAVTCKDCCKPRVIFSISAPRNMVPPNHEDGTAPSKHEVQACMAMAAAAVKEATEGELYICGAQPLSEDHPFHDVFYCYNHLECSTHVEPQFYKKGGKSTTSSIWSIHDMCSICAGTNDQPGQVDDSLNFSTVLPVCSVCLSQGHKHPVTQALANAAAKEAARAKRAAKARLLGAKRAREEVLGALENV
jgi:hypothetical protein